MFGLGFVDALQRVEVWEDGVGSSSFVVFLARRPVTFISHLDQAFAASIVDVNGKSHVRVLPSELRSLPFGNET